MTLVRQSTPFPLRLSLPELAGKDVSSPAGSTIKEQDYDGYTLCTLGTKITSILYCQYILICIGVLSIIIYLLVKFIT